jgi:hypothetical protein
VLAKDGGMNVPNIGQGSGSVTTLPRTLAGAETSAPRADAAVAAPPSRPGASLAISLTRLAWFDVNGDGSIDSRSAAAGGDATLLVPTHEVDLPTYSRPAHPIGGGRPVRDKEPGRSEPGPAAGSPNAAQSNRAADAYERYGQAPPVAPTPVAVATTTTVASAVPATGPLPARPLTTGR